MVIMKRRYVLMALCVLVFSSVLKGQVNPYPDGTVISAGTSVGSTWSIGTGTSVSTAGNFTSGADGTIRGALVVNGDYEHTGWSRDRILSGAVVEVFGNLYASQTLIVQNGATLIVHGDFYNYGGGSTRLVGNVVIGGNAYLNNTTVPPAGNIVVGGNLEMSGGSSANGDIYVLDPGASVNIPGWMGITPGDQTDFENDEAGNTDLNDAVADVGLISTVDAPTSFTYTNLSGSNVDLKWALNADTDSVMIAWSESDLSDRPVDALNYEVGQSLSGGAQIVFKGDIENWTYGGLTPGVTSYFRIWSYTNPAKDYSKSVKLEVKALSTDIIFYDGFESGNTEGWTLGINYGSGNQWYIGNAESYNGSASAYVTKEWDGSVANYNTDRASTIYLQNDINIPSKYKSAELSFYWKGIAEDGYDGGSVRENTNTRLISDISLSNQATWVEEVIDVTDYINTRLDLDFRWYNDGHAGQYSAFCIDEVRIVGSEVARPQAFAGSAVSSEQVDLTWQKSVDGDDVVIAYSPFGSVGRPENGKTYSVGDFLAGGGEVIYVGSALSYSHTENFSGQLKYTIWSVKASAYSSGRSLKVQIPVALPYYEDFENDVSEWNFNSGYDNAWVRGKATSESGTQSAYISYDNGITAGYDVANSADTYLELDIDLRNYETAQLSFNWKGDGSRDNFGAVYVNNTMLNGAGATNNSKYYDRTTWQSESISLNSYTNGIQKIRFRWDNAGWGTAQNPGFCIDNVKVSGTIANPVSFSVVNPNSLYNDLAWTSNAFGDEVIIAVSETGVFGTLDNDITYSDGDLITGGGKVIYVGSDGTFKHEPLNYSTLYYYKIWSVRNRVYSSGIEESASTPEKVSVLMEDWDGNSSGHTWTKSNSGNNSWLVGGNSTSSGTGSNSSYIRSGASTNASYNTNSTSTAWLEVDVDLSDLNMAKLSFDWKSEGELAGGTIYDYGELYINNGSGDQLISGAREFYGTSTWETKTLDLSTYVGSSVTIKFKWKNDYTDGGPLGFCIDNVEVGGIYDPTSRIINGQKLSSSISSIANTQTDEVEVFSFDLKDKSSKYNDITRVQQLLISKGAANDILDWSKVLEGAKLYGPDMPAAGMDGVIASSGITFSGSDMILLQTRNLAETYVLKVWLKSDLSASGVGDGAKFDFAVLGNEMVTGLGDDFIKTDKVESGAIPISVVATELVFSQQPAANATVNMPLGTIAKVSAVDANGNVDIDYVSSISVSNSGPIGMSNSSEIAVSGVSSFSNLIFTQTGNVTLSASSGSLVSAASSLITVSDYCIPSNNSSSRYITNVIVNKINNSTGDDGGYADYLSQEAIFATNESYEITLGVRNNSGTGYAIVWVDWNQNEDFTDAGEAYLIGNTSSTGIQVLKGDIDVPNGAVSGSTRMRVRFSQRSWTGNPCTDSDGEIEDYTVVVTSEGWLGQNNIWNIPSNWSTGSVPGASTDIYIPEHPLHGDVYPIINGTASMNDLSIDNNASLTILAGSQVDVNGDMTILGDLTIENSVADPTSFITEGSISGNSTVKWTYSDNRYFYVGHSVKDASYVSYDNVTSSPFNLYRFPSRWLKVTGGVLNNTGNELQGYAVLFKEGGDVTVSQVGQLNNATYNRVLSGNNLVANPYQSYIDVLGGGVSIPSAADKTIYTSTNSSGVLQYAGYNYDLRTGTNNGSRYIAPGQAFWIVSSGGNLTIDPSARTHTFGSGNGMLKSANAEPNNLLRVELSNENKLKDEIALVFRVDGLMELMKSDSPKRMGTGKGVPNLYCLKGNTKIVIGLYPETDEISTLPLGYKFNEAKELTIKATNIEDFTGAEHVFLVDKEEDVTIDLKQTPEYTFIAKAGEEMDRFELKFEALTTDINDNASQEGLNRDVLIYSIKDQARVKVSEELLRGTERLIEVYNLAGQLINQYDINSTITEFELPQSNTVYIIKVNIDKLSLQQKVVSL